MPEATAYELGSAAIRRRLVRTHSKVAFLVMGFAYRARFDVEDWVGAFEGRLGKNPEVVLYQVPVIGGAYRMFGPMIDAGMRQATPTKAQDSVVTVYGSQRPIREALGAGPGSDIWVYLVDRDGTVLFQRGGAFAPRRLRRWPTSPSRLSAEG